MRMPNHAVAVDARTTRNGVHTSAEFETDLHELRQRVLAMGACCERMTELAFRAFCRGEPAFAAPVAEMEAQLDTDEIEVEALALRIIALRQPVACDLRFLGTALRLVTDLERVGDAAVKIAKGRAVIARDDMLRRALVAFVGRDVHGARHVLHCDEAVDRRCTGVIAKMTAYIATHPGDVSAGLAVLSVAEYLERIGDHAANVAEQVIFMVEGEDVRHRRARSVERFGIRAR